MINYITKIIKEIKAVGIRDWIWFVAYLKRDEFSEKLNLFEYGYKSKNTNMGHIMLKLQRDRSKSHKIDNIFKDIK